MSWLKTIPSEIGTFAYSASLYFYHEYALNLSRKLIYIASGYHNDERFRHGLETCNALFRLGVSERMLNSTFAYFGWPELVHDISKAKVLVPSKNRPADLDSTASNTWKEVADCVEELSKEIFQHSSFIKIDPLTQKNHGDGGVCRGMVQFFIKQHMKGRNNGLGFREAAISAAVSLKNGAPKEAYALQLLHLHTLINPKALENLPYDSDLKLNLELNASTILPIFLSTFANLQITFQEAVPMLDPKNLKDGIYDVGIGMQRKIGDPVNTFYNSLGSGHCIALLVESGSSFIFDPNYGLLEYEDPSAYFKVAKRFDDSIFLIAEIKCNYLKTFNA